MNHDAQNLSYSGFALICVVANWIIDLGQYANAFSGVVLLIVALYQAKKAFLKPKKNKDDE